MAIQIAERIVQRARQEHPRTAHTIGSVQDEQRFIAEVAVKFFNDLLQDRALTVGNLNIVMKLVQLGAETQNGHRCKNNFRSDKRRKENQNTNPKQNGSGSG